MLSLKRQRGFHRESRGSQFSAPTFLRVPFPWGVRDTHVLGGAGPPGPRPPARSGDGQTQSSGLGSGVSSCRSDRKPASPQPHLLTNEIQKNQTKRTKPTMRTPLAARSPLVGRSASLGPASGARERRLRSHRDQPARRLVGFENSNHSQTTLGHSSTC